MILRIKFARGRPIQRKHGKNRHVALAFGSLLTPLALMAYVLGLWRLASDMGMAGAFVITGVFSHWQIWMAIGALLQLFAWVLNRYGYFADFQMPRVLMFHQRPPGTAALPRRKISSR